MNLDEESLAAITDYLEAEADKRPVSRLGPVYWNLLMDGVLDSIRTNQEIRQFLDRENDFINFGLLTELVEDHASVRASIDNRSETYPHIAIRFFTDWIDETLAKIYSADKKDLIARDIERLKLEKKEIERQLEEQQSARRDFIQNELSDITDRAVPVYIDNLMVVDNLFMEGLKTRSASAKGTHMSVEERRAVASRTARYQNELLKVKVLSDYLRTDEQKKTFRTYNAQVNSLMERTMSCEDQTTARQSELAALEDAQRRLSPIEVEGRMRSELEHIRDMTKCCARRLHFESCSLLRPGDQTFTKDKVCSCFDRILEFDPRLFNNFRAKTFGAPSALLIPGNGKALFDWKNNLFLIPLVPPQGDFMGSIATAVIEYRLDIDEDKELTTSYQRIPECKNIKSIITMHQVLTKDYIRWMTFEYNGFKVLSKQIRFWFEHEIAPKKNEIYCPPEYQMFAMSPEEYKEQAANLERRLAQQGENATAEDLWKAHIFAFQGGGYQEAAGYLERLRGREHGYGFLAFNLGTLYQKTGRGQDAKACYQEFMKTAPHSWWTNVAAEHLRGII